MQGHVGVYWRGGKLLSVVSGPGLQLKVPILDLYSPIQVTLQAGNAFVLSADTLLSCKCPVVPPLHALRF